MIGLAMIVKDGARTVQRTLESALPLIDRWTVLDTGSSDGTQEIVERTMGGVPGSLIDHDWVDYAEARTAALRSAGAHTEWVLMVDDDMQVEAHPDTKQFVLSDPDPDVMAWELEIVCGPRVHRLPLLTRSSVEWAYEGACHEYLTPTHLKRRHLLGLQLHHPDAAGDPARHEQYVQLLAAGVKRGEPRAVFYTARALDCLGRKYEAAAMYERRAVMDDFEEEAWYAAYSAALLRSDVGALIAAHRRRPWRPEPLRRAADLVAAGGVNGDVLFVEVAA